MTGTSAGLIETAKKLICDSPDGGEPTPTDCKRAISTAYYALFHFVVEKAVDQITLDCSYEQQEKVYRSISHTSVQQQCKSIVSYNAKDTTPAQLGDTRLRSFVQTYQSQMEDRISADYDVYDEPPNKQQAQLNIASAEQAMTDYEAASSMSQCDFLVAILVKNRHR